MMEYHLEPARLKNLTLTTLERIQSWDEQLIRAVVTSRPQDPHHWINRLMRTLTRSGDADTWTWIIVGLFLAGGIYRDAVFMRVPGLLVTLAVTHALKRWAKRRRPSVKMPDLARLLGNPDEYSFPSSHSACAWAMCLGLSLHFPMAGFFFLPLAAGISWSRIHVGAHYLSDILVGSTIGMAVSYLSHWIILN